METFLQQVVNGLSIGAIYALIAVGYSLVYGLLGLINFAHGDTYMISTFAVLGLASAGWPFGLAVVGGVVVGAGISALAERVAYRPLRGGGRMAPLVAAVGVALILRNLTQLIWGPQTRPFPNPIPSGFITVGGVIIPYLQMIIMATAALCALGLYLLVNRTSWGLHMRAIRDDLPTAELMGIKVNRMSTLVYILGGALGLIGGVLFAASSNRVFIGMGFSGTLNAFTAAVIGGIGSLQGAFVGGITLGLLQTVAVTFIASGYTNTVSFAALVVLLLLRPQGLFGTPAVDRA